MENYLLLTNRNKAKINQYLPSEQDIQKMAIYFQNFSDGTRLKIISCLALCDMCVNDLSLVLNINQTTISHQLKLLKNQNIVSYRREGKIIIYSVNLNKINDTMFYGVQNC